MTGILLDACSGAALLLFSCVSVGMNMQYIDMQYAWHVACTTALVWWGLVLVCFLPAIMHIDTKQWNWPFKQPPSHMGGPPRNTWPRHLRTALSGKEY